MRVQERPGIRLDNRKKLVFMNTFANTHRKHQKPRIYWPPRVFSRLFTANT